MLYLTPCTFPFSINLRSHFLLCTRTHRLVWLPRIEHDSKCVELDKSYSCQTKSLFCFDDFIIKCAASHRHQLQAPRHSIFFGEQNFEYRIEAIRHWLSTDCFKPTIHHCPPSHLVLLHPFNIMKLEWYNTTSLCTVSTILNFIHFWDCHIASILSISNWIFCRILFAVRPSLTTSTFSLLCCSLFNASSGVRVSWRMVIDFSLDFDVGKTHIYRTRAICSLIFILILFNGALCVRFERISNHPSILPHFK